MDSTPMAGGVGTLTKEQPLGLENQLEELLPGIPNEITLNHITTKLLWTDVRILPSLSRAWNRAIQSRQVHCARVQSHSTETLVFVTGMDHIALYSMRAEKFDVLPPIPGVDRCVECNCVSLDDRVYVLGAREQERYHIASDRVDVVGLVGRRRWEQCASMPQAVDEFVCGIVDGKIYVFGWVGDVEDDNLTEVNIAMVYDPTVDAWSPVMPTPDLRWDHGVAVAGGGLFLHSGYRDFDMFQDTMFVLDAYNPVRNEWTKVERGAWPEDYPEAKQVFVADGEVYSMTEFYVHRLDSETNTWIELHSFSFAFVCGVWGDEMSVTPISVVAANGELLAIVSWRGMRDNVLAYGPALLKSKGFGGQSEVIVWEQVICSPGLGHCRCLCPVQL